MIDRSYAPQWDGPALTPNDELDATGALDQFPSEAPPTEPSDGGAHVPVPPAARAMPSPPSQRPVMIAGWSVALLVVLATMWMGRPFAPARDAARSAVSAPPARAQRSSTPSSIPVPLESRPSAPAVAPAPRAIPEPAAVAPRGTAVAAAPTIPAPRYSRPAVSPVARPSPPLPSVASPPPAPVGAADVADARIAPSPEPPAPTERREDAAEPVDPDTAARSAISETLAFYRKSYNNLDAVAVSSISLGLDTRGLQRAFSTLRSQQLSFHKCETTLAGDKAQVRCTGAVNYVPIVGASEPRMRPVAWTFDLRRNASRWLIETVAAR
jgi:hypothetical protein